jgi:hypothetical protein
MSGYSKNWPRSSADDHGYEDQCQRGEDERAKAQQDDFAQQVGAH